jgi:predicted acyltransferase
VIGAFIAATVVALAQYVRTRDRRLLPLMAMFLLQASSLSLESWDRWRDLFQAAVCLAGVVLVLMLPGRPSGVPKG